MSSSSAHSLSTTNPSGAPASTDGNAHLAVGVEPAPSAINPSDFEQAFATVEGEIRTVPADKVVHITVDVRNAAVNTVARLPRLEELRDQIVALPGFEVEAFNRLKTYALGAAHAYFLHQMSAASPAEVAELAERAAERRSVRLADVRALVARGLIDGAPLEKLGGSSGHRSTAYDLILLRNLLVEAWPQITGQTLLTADDLEEDASLASQLLMAAGAKSVEPVEPTETALVRDQAFTLFVNKYDQVRRAVTYVRWDEGDADEYAPSLYAGRGPRRRESATVVEVPEGENTESTLVIPANTGRAAGVAETSASNASAPATPRDPAADPFAP
jgi:hypothetical protein